MMLILLLKILTCVAVRGGVMLAVAPCVSSLAIAFVETGYRIRTHSTILKRTHNFR